MRQYLFILIAFLSQHVSAFDAEINGIYYNFSGDEAEVTFQKQVDSFPSFISDYSGDRIIPEHVTYNSKTYKVTRIGHFAFNGCKDLTSIVIPNSVISIGRDAFYYCSNMTSITIPESVTNIGENAFYYCSSLASITIPESVTSIGCGAFYGSSWYDSQPDGLVYAGKVAYRYKGIMPTDTSITIDEGTLGIADNAFSNCSGLTSVTIPNSITSIGKEAFSECTNLTFVSFGNNVTSIGGGAFENCSSLAKVIVPDIAAWCEISFADYSANPLYYAQHIFSDEATEITELFIPDGVNSINSFAFPMCNGLTSVIIPNSVTNIGRVAFYGCKNMIEVYCCAENVPSTNINAFNSLPIASATLFVPACSADIYKTTSPWSSFGKIVALTEDEITPVNNIINDESSITQNYYDMYGRCTQLPHRGIFIIGGRKMVVKK